MTTQPSDFFEVDFLGVETKQSGDAITLRYCVNGMTSIHVVDGGFQETGDAVTEHIRRYYGEAAVIDRVVATHPDGDHLGGLRSVLEDCDVRELWMLRPWLYASEIISRFESVTSLDHLVRALKEAYPNVAALEEIAARRKIPIKEPFQGATLGAFTVLAPKKARFLDLVVSSEKTPKPAGTSEKSAAQALMENLRRATTRVASFVKTMWGVENFSDEEISAENKMSVMQYAAICDKRILLTADAGLESFAEAAAYAPNVGLVLPGIDRFQVPHHGSRRNVSTAMLDQWLAQRLPSPLPRGEETFHAIISSAKADPDHPRKSVVRAMHHRGAFVAATEGRNIQTRHNSPARAGWSAIEPDPYPPDQEE